MPSKGSTASNAETTRRQEGAGASPVAVSPPPVSAGPGLGASGGGGGASRCQQEIGNGAGTAIAAPAPRPARRRSRVGRSRECGQPPPQAGAPPATPRALTDQPRGAGSGTVCERALRPKPERTAGGGRSRSNAACFSNKAQISSVFVSRRVPESWKAREDRETNVWRLVL